MHAGECHKMVRPEDSGSKDFNIRCKLIDAFFLPSFRP